MFRKVTFWLGLLLIATYWLHIRPIALQRGYVEDYCTFEMSRQIMADQLKESGGPRFETQHYMHPHGIKTAYMPQSIEQTWLGAYFWNLNPDFPYFWAYFGISLLVTYLGVGWILRRMHISTPTAWALSCGLTLLHIPRHFVTWYHSEHMYLHWIYLGFFLDAWIWQRAFRENRWSWVLDIWRGFFLLAVFGTAGYFWGPSFVEWLILRFCLIYLAISRSRSNSKLKLEGEIRSAILPGVLCLIWLGIELRWFIPLITQALQLGKVPQGLGMHAPVLMVARPLWFDWFMQAAENLFPFLRGHWRSFRFPETVVTIGWFYWIPAVIGILSLRKRRLGPGVIAAMPFLILLFIAIWYLGIKPHIVQSILQTLIPLMAFFRVASRWGLFLPPIVGAIIVLSWPELSKWFRAQVIKPGKKFKPLLSSFIILSIVECLWLLSPPLMMQPFSTEMKSFLENIRSSPGTAVLDMPFCTTGGNSVCNHQCPAYPYSTVGACLRQWHNKDVYGIYESRLVPTQCETYDKSPYTSWFQAWKTHRCLTPPEWVEFCNYLDTHTELSSILVYPDLWQGSSSPECRNQFEKYLGTPIAVSSFYGNGDPKKSSLQSLHVIRYAAKCRKIK